MPEFNEIAQAQIRMADVYETIESVESSGSPMVIPLKGTLEILLALARDRSNVQGTGCSGWLGEMIWIRNGQDPMPATIIAYTETRTAQTIIAQSGASKVKMLRFDLKEYGTTFFKTPEAAMEGDQNGL